MKNLITFLLLLGTFTFCDAQISLQIPDLVQAKKVPLMPATSAELTTVSIPNARGGGSTNRTVWIISRVQDQFSNAIQDASNRGRAFNNLVVTIGRNRQELRQGLISNYSISASGNTASETFYIQFSN